MLRWWKARSYAAEVKTQLIVLLLLLDGSKLVGQHEGISAAIQANFDEGVSSDVAATHLAAALIADAIERSSDIAQKERVAEQLEAWAKLEYQEQRGISQKLREGALSQDFLLTRCQWLLMRGQSLLLDGKIEVHDFRILKDSIWGPLKGENIADRAMMRLEALLDDILGPTPS